MLISEYLLTAPGICFTNFIFIFTLIISDNELFLSGTLSSMDKQFSRNVKQKYTL